MAQCPDFFPAKSKTETRLKTLNMTPPPALRDAERKNYAFFFDIPEYDRRQVKVATLKGSQVLQPLFEYSCAGAVEKHRISSFY